MAQQTVQIAAAGQQTVIAPAGQIFRAQNVIQAANLVTQNGNTIITGWSASAGCFCVIFILYRMSYIPSKV